MADRIAIPPRNLLSISVVTQTPSDSVTQCQVTQRLTPELRNNEVPSHPVTTSLGDCEKKITIFTKQPTTKLSSISDNSDVVALSLVNSFINQLEKIMEQLEFIDDTIVRINELDNPHMYIVWHLIGEDRASCDPDEFTAEYTYSVEISTSTRRYSHPHEFDSIEDANALMNKIRAAGQFDHAYWKFSEHPVDDTDRKYEGDAECQRCKGTGMYIVGTENGKPKFGNGICYRCAGKGFHNKADRKRNSTWIQYAAARSA